NRIGGVGHAHGDQCKAGQPRAGRSEGQCVSARRPRKRTSHGGNGAKVSLHSVGVHWLAELNDSGGPSGHVGGIVRGRVAGYNWVQWTPIDLSDEDFYRGAGHAYRGNLWG